MNFILYEDESAATRVLCPTGVLAGGMQVKGNMLTIYSPKIPPLPIPCADEPEAQALMSAVVLFLANHPGVPGVSYNDYFSLLNVNRFFLEFRAAENALLSAPEDEEEPVDFIEAGG